MGVVTREKIRNWLERKFFLRIHMTLILGGTFLAGLAATTVLMILEVNILALRYGLAVFAAYLMFLVLIKLWLYYVRMSRDAIDITIDGIEFFGDVGGEAYEHLGGGGSFGGGGASGSWEDPLVVPAKALKSSGGSGSGKGLFNFSIDGGDEGCALVLFVLLVFGLLFASVYLIYTAPVILAEAAFEAALAGALARRARRVERGNWVGAVWRATVWPFLAILVLSVALGWFAQRSCPAATKLADVWNCGVGKGPVPVTP
ncbi:MAG TPA: hypothetical protein VEK11_15695 [Thermoanaerobaculia bacterium]|nr:hypothetical protein [Thermoanaerobaculia bacterium]